MYCNKCGNHIEPNTNFCNKCGNQINTSQNNYNQSQFAVPNQNIISNQDTVIPPQNTYNYNQVPNKNKSILIKGVCAGIGVFLIIILIFSLSSKNDYYFGESPNNSNNEIVTNTKIKTKKGKYSTSIIYDNTYDGVNISNDTDAINLIVKDSIDQKSKCPKEIRAIEDEIINKYGIKAVNLCELDVNFAKEIGNVFKKVYDEYPSVRGYFTNLTLVNGSMSDSYIAAFMPAFTFATSSSSTTYPWVIKTQMLLNTSYFLNREKLEASVKSGSASGHFPKNATVYSPVAHELGHYLSFLAMMKHYNLNSILLIDSSNNDLFYKVRVDFSSGEHSLSMIKEAYENYKKDYGTTQSIDEWRGTISQYALAKNNNGKYIYDETIAESFHDVYLNGDNAAIASKYVVNVLKKRLGG